MLFRIHLHLCFLILFQLLLFVYMLNQMFFLKFEMSSLMLSFLKHFFLAFRRTRVEGKEKYAHISE